MELGSLTENYRLLKPDKKDFYRVDDFNENADIIDNALKALKDKDVTLENSINSLSEVAKSGDYNDLENKTVIDSYTKFDDYEGTSPIVAYEDENSWKTTIRNIFNMIDYSKTGIIYIPNNSEVVELYNNKVYPDDATSLGDTLNTNKGYPIYIFTKSRYALSVKCVIALANGTVENWFTAFSGIIGDKMKWQRIEDKCLTKQGDTNCDETDFNDMTNIGVYNCSGTVRLSSDRNQPDGVYQYGTLSVLQTDSYAVTQIYCTHSHKMFFRTGYAVIDRTDGSWNDWKEVLTTANGAIKRRFSGTAKLTNIINGANLGEYYQVTIKLSSNVDVDKCIVTVYPLNNNNVHMKIYTQELYSDQIRFYCVSDDDSTPQVKYTIAEFY